MDVHEKLSEVSALFGDAARISMLWHLLGGEVRSASELAFLANVSPQSASAHLAKLVAGNIVMMTRRGRNRFYSIARPEVASAVEAIAALVPSRSQSPNLSIFKVSDFSVARSCYDHLAGKISIEIAQTLQRRRHLLAEEKNFILTETGEKWFTEFGIKVDNLREQRRAFAGKCFDLSERKYHLAGALGAALLQELLRQKWLTRSGERVLKLTFHGRKNLDSYFGIKL